MSNFLRRLTDKTRNPGRSLCIFEFGPIGTTKQRQADVVVQLDGRMCVAIFWGLPKSYTGTRCALYIKYILAL